MNTIPNTINARLIRAWPERSLAEIGVDVRLHVKREPIPGWQMEPVRAPHNGISGWFVEAVPVFLFSPADHERWGVRLEDGWVYDVEWHEAFVDESAWLEHVRRDWRDRITRERNNPK